MKVRAKRYVHAAECGAQIRELRKARGLTQTALADLTGFSSQQIGLVEKGEINTPIETLARIAMALEVPLHMVCRDEETPTTIHCARIATHLRSALAEVEALAPGVVSLCP